MKRSPSVNSVEPYSGSIFDDIDYVSKMDRIRKRNLGRITQFDYFAPAKIRLRWCQHKEGWKLKFCLKVRNVYPPFVVFGEGIHKKDAKQDAALQMYRRLKDNHNVKLDYYDDCDEYNSSGIFSGGYDNYDLDYEEIEKSKNSISILEEYTNRLFTEKPKYSTAEDKLNLFANLRNHGSSGQAFVTKCSVTLSGIEQIKICEQGIALCGQEAKTRAADNVIKHIQKHYPKVWDERRFKRRARRQGRFSVKRRDPAALIDAEYNSDNESNAEVDDGSGLDDYARNLTEQDRVDLLRLKHRSLSTKKNAKSLLGELVQEGLLLSMPRLSNKEDDTQVEIQNDDGTQKISIMKWQSTCTVALTERDVQITKSGHAIRRSDALTRAAENVIDYIKENYPSTRIARKLSQHQKQEIESHVANDENERPNQDENDLESKNSVQREKVRTLKKYNGKNARTMLEEFASASNPKILNGKPNYHTRERELGHHLNPDQTAGRYYWYATCSVAIFSFEDELLPIFQNGFGTKKDEAKEEAAEKVMQIILRQHYTDAVQMKLENKKAKIDPVSFLNLDDDSDSGFDSDSDDEAMEEYEDGVDVVENKCKLFDSSKPEFALLDSYPVAVVHSNDDANEWITKNLSSEDKDEEISVMFNSSEMHAMLRGSATSEVEIVHEKDRVMAIATASGVLLCVGSDDSDWPMPAVRDVLHDNSRSISTILPNHGVDLKLTHVLDIREHAYCTAYSRVADHLYSEISPSLKKLVEIFLRKSFGNPYKKVNEHLKTAHPLANVVVSAAVAILAVYRRISSTAKAEHRERDELWSAEGSLDLMNIISGNLPLGFREQSGSGVQAY